MESSPLSQRSKSDYLESNVKEKFESLGASALGKIPKEGFLKISNPEKPALTPEQRAHLIRKGNELFALGNWEQAKKIFVSTGYTDGMIRIGDHYVQEKDYLLAFQMYKMAPAPDKAEQMVEHLSAVLRNWLKE